jgi:CheY-like chemotaxis protein
VIARAIETVQPLIEVQAQRLEVHVPEESLRVEADPVRLTQVLGNLLTNAAKYTDANGRIAISAERAGSEALIRVRDEGIGIATDMLPQVFELFVQADHAEHRSQGGLGIGLTLVRNLVEMHGGTVGAYSAGIGRGAEFTVRLPLLPQETRYGQAQAAVPVLPAASGHRLLVVDDNEDAAASLAMLLRLKGHEVEIAHDGPSALRLAREFRPALVFLDLGMPGMDGFEVARALRATPGLEDVHIVALTGWGQDEDRRSTREAGFDQHLVKPPDVRMLDQLLADLEPTPAVSRRT